MYQEINFDGLVGPTHNYAGLSVGNVASVAHRDTVSHPKNAALQGLRKMKALADLGIPQAVLPPLERPSIPWLRRFGIEGESEQEVLANAARNVPTLLAVVSSASSMWTANAATMAPSCDTRDRRAHFTPANLSSKLHRAIEADETTSILRKIFSDTSLFCVHSPLEGGHAMSDEGAANHTRLSPDFATPALHLFVYGVTSLRNDTPRPGRFPARQTLEASETVARLHRLPGDRTVFVQQSPEAIDAGVFHNDVIAVGHLSTLLYHEKAFAKGEQAIETIAAAFPGTLNAIRVPEERVPLSEAVSSYLFNSQMISVPGGGTAIVAPTECQTSAAVSAFLDGIVSSPGNDIQRVHYLDLKESMRNGGGPACLRQRVVLNDQERAALSGRVFLDDALFEDLVGWVAKHYRDELRKDDLSDPHLLRESRSALDDLTGILQLDNLYPFQR